MSWRTVFGRPRYGLPSLVTFKFSVCKLQLNADALSIFHCRKFENIYIGYGHKYSAWKLQPRTDCGHSRRIPKWTRDNGDWRSNPRGRGSSPCSTGRRRSSSRRNGRRRWWRGWGRLDTSLVNRNISTDLLQFVKNLREHACERNQSKYHQWNTASISKEK